MIYMFCLYHFSPKMDNKKLLFNLVWSPEYSLSQMYNKYSYNICMCYPTQIIAPLCVSVNEIMSL